MTEALIDRLTATAANKHLSQSGVCSWVSLVYAMQMPHTTAVEDPESKQEFQKNSRTKGMQIKACLASVRHGCKSSNHHHHGS